MKSRNRFLRIDQMHRLKSKNKRNPKPRTSYRKGFFKTDNGHRLYYELYGNPKGVPVVFLHGGPGAGFSERSKRYFDPKLHNVLLFDQRGAGRSRPFASLKANTTAHLVRDITALMDFVGFEKALFCGGSWGSTLALVFAIQNPNRVSGLVVRGIFLANKAAMDPYVTGAVRNFYPDVWERFITMVPPSHRKAPLQYYYQQMKSASPAKRRKYAYEWARYEISIAPLHKPDEKQIDTIIREFSYVSLSTLEAHYIQALCFLPENYILKNAHKITHLPTDISHGRYDLVCPPEHAQLLHERLPKSSLTFFVEGHYITSRVFTNHTRNALKNLAKPLRRSH